MTNAFGRWLRQLRDDRHWSLREAGRRTGVHYAHLSMLERGIKTPPQTRNLLRLARGFGVPSDDLFRMARRMPPDVEGRLWAHPDGFDLIRRTYPEGT